MIDDSEELTFRAGGAAIPFIGRTRRFAIGLLAFFILVWIVMAYFIFQSSWQRGLERAENEVRKMTLMQQAIREYVDRELKPLFFSLQQQESLPADFYAPQGFSATYVIAHIFKFYDQKVDDNLAELQNGVRFRVVSDNPLNPHNLANDEQMQWLTYFRNHPQQQEALQLVRHDGKPTELRLYWPSPPNTQACLRCHGDPMNAPMGLRRLYGTASGFGEQVGWIRGLSEYRIDLRPLWQIAWRHTIQLSLALFAVMMLLWAGIVWVYHRLMVDRELILSQKQRLFELANCDALTHLYNRHRLNLILPQKLAQLRAGQLTSLVAIMVDIDHFKPFNDRYGHDMGDRVLKQVAETLRQIGRSVGCSAFRLGGEEFLLLLEHPPEDQPLCTFLQQCHRQFTQHYEDVPEPITFSAGAAVASPDDTPSTLLKKADIALYYVKQHGRNGIACYDTLPKEERTVEEC